MQLRARNRASAEVLDLKMAGRLKRVKIANK